MGLTIQAWNTENTTYNTSRGAGVKEADERQNVFGGSLQLGEGPIAQRRKEAQEQAWNVVKNAWDTDKSIDDSIQARRDHYARMKDLQEELVGQLKDVKEDEQVLQTLYGVEDGSQEQQDLELLKKEQDEKNKVPGRASLTDEERERLAQIHERPLTEYQERALELNERAGVYKSQLLDTERRMADDTADIRAIERQRPEYQPMIEAQKTAEKILDAANGEIKGMVVQDAVDHIDEKMEDAEEKMDEAAEAREEREEKLKEQKLQKAIREAMIEGTKEAVEKVKREAQRTDAPDIELTDMVDMMRGGDAVKDVGQSLDDIKSSMRVLEADLKGIKVDEEI